MFSKKIILVLTLFTITFSSAYTLSETSIIPSFFTGTTSTATVTSEDVATTAPPTFESASLSSSSFTSTFSTASVTSSSLTTASPATFTSGSISVSSLTTTTSTATIPNPTNTFKAFTVVSIQPSTFTLTGTSSGLVTEPTFVSTSISPSTFTLTGTSSSLTSEPIVTTTSISPSTFTLTGVSLRPDQQNVADNEPEFIFDADEEKEELIIESSSTTLTKITVTEETTNPKLNFENILTTEGDGTKSVTYPNPLELDTTTPELRVDIDMPTGIKIMGDADWDGVILLPTFKETSTVDAGTNVATAVIEVGLADKELTFDKPVRISFDGKAGEQVSFERSGISTIISTICDEDSESSVIAQLGGTGECTITVGADQVIWTFHYTTFFTSTPSLGSSGSGGGGGDSTPPSYITAFDETEHPFSINGNSFSLNELDDISLTTVETGKLLHLQIKLFDNAGPQNIQHVSLYLNQHGNRILNDLTETSITFEKGKDTEIIDPHELIESASVVSSTLGNKAVFDFEVTFSKEMDTSDLLFRVWDFKRNSVDLHIPESLTVMLAEPTSEIIESGILQERNVESTIDEETTYPSEQQDSIHEQKNPTDIVTTVIPQPPMDSEPTENNISPIESTLESIEIQSAESINPGPYIPEQISEKPQCGIGTFVEDGICKVIKTDEPEFCFLFWCW